MQNYDPQQDVIPAAPEPQRPVPGTAKAFSIVAFVCGICSLVTLFVGIQFGIAGLVFASLSRRRAGFDLPRNRKGRIMSIIGLIVSVLWLILYIILFVYAVNGIVDGTIPTRRRASTSSTPDTQKDGLHRLWWRSSFICFCSSAGRPTSCRSRREQSRSPCRSGRAWSCRHR